MTTKRKGREFKEPEPKGWQITLSSGAVITAWDRGDDSFSFHFENGGNQTDIRLSREAVNAMKFLLLHHAGGLDA